MIVEENMHFSYTNIVGRQRKAGHGQKMLPDERRGGHRGKQGVEGAGITTGQGFIVGSYMYFTQALHGELRSDETLAHCTN
jgi:hypothetical protein